MLLNQTISKKKTIVRLIYSKILKVFLQIDRFFPSSKTCNHCLNVVDSLPLDVRTWDCPSCNTQGIDRDLNAARNCRDEGIRILSCGTRDTANGGNVRQRRGRKSTVVAVADEFGSQHSPYRVSAW